MGTPRRACFINAWLPNRDSVLLWQADGRPRVLQDPLTASNPAESTATQTLSNFRFFIHPRTHHHDIDIN